MDIFGLVMFLAPVAATPQLAAPAKSPVYVMAVEEGKVVCRRVSEAHTRIPTRICRTELQWEEIARENQDALNTQRRNETRSQPPE